MVKKKAGGSGRSSKAKGKITGDKPEEPQERQDKESREVNSPRSIEEKRTEARDQRNQPRSEPYVSRYRSRHCRGSHSIRQGGSRIRHRSRRRSITPRRGDRRQEDRRPVSRSYYREREDLRRGRSWSRSRQKNSRRGRSWSRNRQASNPFSEGRYSRERRQDRTRCRERGRDQHDSRTTVSAGNFDCNGGTGQ